jgi:hypothetical protein
MSAHRVICVRKQSGRFLVKADVNGQAGSGSVENDPKRTKTGQLEVFIIGGGK